MRATSSRCVGACHIREVVPAILGTRTLAPPATPVAATLVAATPVAATPVLEAAAPAEGGEDVARQTRRELIQYTLKLKRQIEGI